jgi:hypothetical protein
MNEWFGRTAQPVLPNTLTPSVPSVSVIFGRTRDRFRTDGSHSFGVSI